MRKSWLTAVAATLLAAVLGIGIARADVLADVKKKGVLVVGTKADYRPFGYLDPSGKIVGFEPGDKLDLSGIDADATVAGNQSFTLLSGGAFTAAGQLSVTFESRDGNDVTVIRGNVNANNDADFELELEGHRELNNQNLNL